MELRARASSGRPRRANDFAHGCKLPVEDLAACLEIACTRDPRPIDVGRMNGQSFINVASGGFDVAPEATLDDRLLDVAIIRHREGFAIGKLAQELKNPTDPANEIVLYRQLPAFTIEADEAFHMNLDGEPNLAHRFEFSMLTRHLEVVY